MDRIYLVPWTLISHFNYDLKYNANIDGSLRICVDHRGTKSSNK